MQLTDMIVEYQQSDLDEIQHMKHMLPPYQSSDDCHSSFPTEDSCASFNLGISLTESSPLSMNGQRRPSFDSLESSIPPELLSSSSVGTMSPSTPLNNCSFNSNYIETFRNVALQVDLQSMWNQHPEEFSEHDFGYSPVVSRENSLPKYINPYSVNTRNPTESCFNSSFGSFSGENISPALSRPMFNQSIPSSMPVVNNTLWPSATIAQTPPRTIDPATFAPRFPSTPTMKVDGPSTPSRLHTRSSVILSSSPMSIYSPGVLPSQREVDDSTYVDSGGLSRESIDLAYESLNMNMDMRDRSRDQSRLTRRRYDRKGSGSGCKRRPLANKSGFECDRVITANSFACSYSECIDKNTGKQKRFKRAEHKKRHEKTVHQKESHVSHKCWVPQCEKSFSRTDNLKSHLQKTHGKRSAGARNRYVATLDPNNTQYFAPDWQGDLTSDGLPVRTRA